MPFDPHQRARFLSDEALVSGLAHEDQQWLQKHMLHCAACAAHAETTLRMLSGLHSLSFEVEPSLHARVQAVVTAHVRRTVPRSSWRWAMIGATIAAAVVLLVSTPDYHDQAGPRHDTDQDRADAALLERVEAGVSREIPRAMEPLIQAGEVR